MAKKHRSQLGDRIHSTLEANTEGSRKEQEEKKVDYMKTIINASKIIYMWPVEDKTFSKSIGHHLGAWMVFVYCLLFLASFFLQIVFHFQDVAGQAQTIDFTTVIISGAFRYAYIYFRSEKYLKLARMIRNGFIHRPFFSTNDEITLHKYYKNGLKIICFYSALVISWIIQVLTLPIVKYVSAMSGSTDGNEMNATELTLLIPIDAYFPFNHDTLPVVVGLYIFQLFGFFFYMLIYLLVDNFWYLVIMLTIGQFALLKVSFESITKDLDDLECTTEEESITLETQALEFGEKLKKCISHHTFLREFVILCDDLLNPNVLIDSLHAIISIAFILLEVTVSINTRSLKKLTNAMLYLIASVSHMYIFDSLGNELTAEEEELSNAIYALPWFKFPTEKSKIAMPIMLSSQPPRLTGGRIYNLSLEFFTRTMRVIFSYFTFLMQIHKTEM